MRTIINNKIINLNPQRDISKKMGAWCLCPTWMGWMPWLVDGVEVPRGHEKTIEINRTGRQRQDCQDGL